MTPFERAAEVAVVGAGLMGGAMLRRLRALGWTVVACDLDERRRAEAAAVGATLAPTAAHAARALGSEGVMIVCVVDATQTRDVLFGEHGAAAALPSGATVMLCPTIAPEDSEALAEALHAQGLAVIDAPMSGGPARAEAGEMSLMLAAPTAVLERHARLLQALSSQRFVVGERVGDGARTKLVNNLLAGVQLVAVAEALALAERVGLDAARTLEVIERSSGQSWIGSDRMRRRLAGRHQPQAHLSLLAKDTALACGMAEAAGWAGPLGPRAAEVFRQACEAGWAPQDDGAMLDWMRGRRDGL